MTFIYAKCSALDKLKLWDSLYYLASNMKLPWLVGGDFNVLLNEEDKIGGLPVYPPEFEDFSFCVNSCELLDTGYKGSPFTWWNVWPNAECIFKRLDKIFVNSPFQSLFPTTEVEHLIRTGSDHAPLFMTCGEATTTFTKPFKFQNFWTKHTSFKEGHPQATRFKGRCGQNKEADRNTRFFHDDVNDKRQKLQLKRIQNHDGNWIELQERMADAAVEFFQNQFTQEDDHTRVVHDRLEKILPSLISSNQSGFVKGRSIFETILLTQEIVTYIRLREKPANVVIKLNMEKAYDRVSWKYLMHILRKMGFAECFINMIWNLISNNWCSVLINGQASGLFHSTRGVKQGDPLSPSLFIISLEVLSRSLNKLFEDMRFKGFGMPKWADPLNHLAYADNTIIFSSADPYSLRKIVKVLSKYEHTSGQMINKTKSSFYMHYSVSSMVSNSIGTITGFSKGEFPFTYLGWPIFYTRRRKDCYNDLIKNVKAKLHSWKWKPLSYGGKSTLISSVLRSMPTHILSVIDPPKNVIEHLHKAFARFFWSTKEESRSRHWTKWKNLCLPKEEGGVGFRSLHDVLKALFAKLWWKFRTSKSLWSNFMWNKYCKKEIPTTVQFRQGSHVWRKILEAREEVEHKILWKMNRGSANEVAEFRVDDTWDEQLLAQSFPANIAQHIRQKVIFGTTDDSWDVPRWMPSPSGNFSVSSAWNILRHRDHVYPYYNKLWTKGSSNCNHMGTLEEEKYDEIGEITNLVAEAKAIVEGLAYCVERQQHPLIMETDSLAMRKIIDGEWANPWCIGAEVRKIKHIKNNYNVVFQYVLREGNIVADFFANLAFNFAGTHTFQSFNELPSAGKKLINMDKSQIPNLQIRIVKRRELY
ncbi:uncharacterized protein LOC142169603 [Nicotiana tabacum]|uniref:Uncharacterized protein LOC142169603 n=1 Tax=Nicotiana tabacum TaxID=4097 RepID=A0AC58SRJ8_TOBAC